MQSFQYFAESAVNDENLDLYYSVISYLIDEGYADCTESARNILMYMSEEWSEVIVNDILQEVKGYGGHIDPQTGELTGRVSKSQERIDDWRRSGLKKDTRRSKHKSENTYNTETTPSHRGLHRGSKEWLRRNDPDLAMTPARRAELAAARAERQGQGKRANKIRARIRGASGES